MNKMKLLVAPLLSVAFLASCGGNKPDPEPIVHTVTEEEFNDACSFKDIQYVQADSENTSFITQSEVMINSQIFELSPSVSYSLIKIDKRLSNETYIKKSGEGESAVYRKAYRKKEGGDFKFMEAGEDDFITPQSEIFNIANQLTALNLTYKSFNYDEENEEYVATYHSEMMGSKITGDWKIKFNNAKVASMYLSRENETNDIADGFSVATYTYNEATPEFPEEPTSRVNLIK